MAAGGALVTGWEGVRERIERQQRWVELERAQGDLELDQALRTVGRLKPLTGRDKERQEFLRQWLELELRALKGR
jgi:hypothetical protein